MNGQHSIRVLALYCQVWNHYVIQCCPRPLPSCGVARRSYFFYFSNPFSVYFCLPQTYGILLELRKQFKCMECKLCCGRSDKLCIVLLLKGLIKTLMDMNHFKEKWSGIISFCRLRLQWRQRKSVFNSITSAFRDFVLVLFSYTCMFWVSYSNSINTEIIIIVCNHRIASIPDLKEIHVLLWFIANRTTKIRWQQFQCISINTPLKF